MTLITMISVATPSAIPASDRIEMMEMKASLRLGRK
jgi:hypothetical protein